LLISPSVPVFCIMPDIVKFRVLSKSYYKTPEKAFK